MSKPEKEKFMIVLCSICKAKIKISETDFKQNKNYGQYILRHGVADLTALQAGNLCEACEKKPLEQRIVYKK